VLYEGPSGHFDEGLGDVRCERTQAGCEPAAEYDYWIHLSPCADAF
jgi:hypothetical protein